jgi:tetratricopeptide (TPR) repeat protein
MAVYNPIRMEEAMNRAKNAGCATAGLLVLALFISSCGFLNKDVKRAEEFMAADMYPQAIVLLSNRLNDDPDNAQAHFLLGVSHIYTGKYAIADDFFKSAIRLDPDYGYQVGAEYKKAANRLLKNKNAETAITLFKTATAYQPDLKPAVARETFRAGKKYLDQGHSDVADGFLKLAVAYDRSLEAEYNAITWTYGKKLLQTAAEKPKAERKAYIDEAAKYLPAKTIDRMFPPPLWKTVVEIVVSGKGADGDNVVNMTDFIDKFKAGDKIVLDCEKANHFFVLQGREWEVYEGRYEIQNLKAIGTSGTPNLYLRADRGIELRISLQRLVSSY